MHLARPVKLGTILWGLLLTGLGAFLLAGGAPGMATGPRIGLGMLFLTIGGLVLVIPFSRWMVLRRAVPEDYEGRCPVGESCTACGAFNYRPRRVCRSCGGVVNA